MKYINLLSIVLISSFLFTSCQKKENVEERYVGQWTLEDISGGGTASLESQGIMMDIILKNSSSEAAIDIRENGEVAFRGIVSITEEFYTEDKLVHSEELEMPHDDVGTWTIDGADAFNSEIFGDSRNFRFEGEKLIVTDMLPLETLDLTEAGVDLGLDISLTMEVVYIRS